MCLNSGVIIRGLIIKVKQCERGLKPATTCFAETLSQHVVAGFSPRSHCLTLIIGPLIITPLFRHIMDPGI